MTPAYYGRKYRQLKREELAKATELPKDRPAQPTAEQ